MRELGQRWEDLERVWGDPGEGLSTSLRQVDFV